MKLKDYLKLINKKPVTWANESGLDPATIWRAFTGKCEPSPKTVKEIEKATEGAVKFDDWY